MEVEISVPGTFHAFRLAEQLETRDALNKLYTTHPRFKINTSLPRSRVQPVRHAEMAAQLSSKVPVLHERINSAKVKARLFDQSVARHLSAGPNSLFVGFAGSTLRSVRRGNELGYTTMVERCSSHIRTQARILQEEYERFGVDGTPISETHIKHEEQEYEAANYIVTPSEFVYNSFIEQDVPEAKVVCEPFGVDTERYVPRDRDEETVTFLFAGRVGLRKGVHYLLKAWDELNLSNAELLIAGGIEKQGRELVEAYADDDSIKFLGWVDEVQSLYARSSVFVLPTLEEGSAYVTYEAMASGLPIVTTSHSGWVGTDGDHGIEVSIRDAEALADEMQSLYEDRSLCAELGKNGRRLVESTYTWDDYGERIFARYKEMLNA